MAVTKILLNARSFPPGSSREFIDAMVRINDSQNLAGQTADDAKDTADGAQTVAEAQRVRNDAQDIVLTNHASQLAALRTDVDNHTAQIGALDTRIDTLEDWRTYTTRQKSEVVYSGISVVIPTTGVNLLTLLNGLTPTSGTLAPFFNTASGLLKALNKNLNLYIKISIRGTFAGGTGNRSMQLVFNTTVPDTLVSSRNAATTVDDILFNTFFSVEEGDNITSPGVTMTATANGGAFTATEIKLIATQ